MTDWQYQNGNLLMMIRDTGGNVEFWVQPDKYTWNNDQTWSYYANGASHSGVSAISASTWTRLAYVNVTTDQTVNFTINDAGLGFPTHTFAHAISRSSVPDPPRAPYFGTVTNNQVHVAFDDNGNGGDNIDDHQIWYSDTTSPKWLVSGTRDATIGGLTSGKVYYFWGKAHNSLGWSGFGARSSVETDRVPDAPNVATFSNIVDTALHAAFTFTGKWDGGSPILEYQIGYGTDPNTQQLFISGSSVDINALAQNQLYYFWTRARNTYGWGNWSARSQAVTLGPPAAPNPVSLSNPTQASVDFAFTTNATNGKPINGWQIAHGKDPAGPTKYEDVSGLTGTISDLDPGTLNYVWARVKNDYGWSALSPVQSIQTYAGSWINVNGVWKQAVPYVNVGGVWKVAKAYAKIAGVWKETG